MSKESREGYTAYHYHIELRNNPYEKLNRIMSDKSEKFKEWEKGWYSAEDDDAILHVDSHLTR